VSGSRTPVLKFVKISYGLSPPHSSGEQTNPEIDSSGEQTNPEIAKKIFKLTTGIWWYKSMESSESFWKPSLSRKFSKEQYLGSLKT
jgi:hypothetical protein